MTARWLALSVDVTDVDRMTAFWAGATGLTPGPVDDEGFVELRGGPEGSELVVSPVPEPRTVKQRVHLDLHCGSVADLAALGATVVGTDQPWGPARPRGRRLCGFVRDEVPAYRVYEVVVDAAEPERIARWWADRVRHRGPQRGRALVVAGGRPRGCRSSAWWLAPVPEPQTVKNRVHWDVRGVVDEFLAGGGDGAVGDAALDDAGRPRGQRVLRLPVLGT